MLIQGMSTSFFPLLSVHESQTSCRKANSVWTALSCHSFCCTPEQLSGTWSCLKRCCFWSPFFCLFCQGSPNSVSQTLTTTYWEPGGSVLFKETFWPYTWGSQSFLRKSLDACKTQLWTWVFFSRMSLLWWHSMYSYWEEKPAVRGVPCMPWQPHHIHTTALWEQPSSYCTVYKIVLLCHCPHDITSEVVHKIPSWLSYPLFQRVC